jgi:hypothetical protein
MIISIEVEKAFNEIQLPFMVKTEETRNRRNVPSIIRPMYNKLISNIILNGEKTEIISSKLRNKTNVFTLPTLL